MSNQFAFQLLLMGCLLLAPGCGGDQEAGQPSNSLPGGQIEKPQDSANQNPGANSKDADASWNSLFNETDLTGWVPTNFGAEGEVTIEQGAIRCEMGYPMTGVTWSGDSKDAIELPTARYEISLLAQRVDGNDFFCGLTFPVNDSHCSLIVGGWGGTLVGLSCIDGKDAANNDTRLNRNFKTGQWYRIRVQVYPDRIRAAIDGDWVIDRDIANAEISVRNETLPCRPLGICCFDTVALFKDIRIRRLATSE